MPIKEQRRKEKPGIFHVSKLMRIVVVGLLVVGSTGLSSGSGKLKIRDIRRGRGPSAQTGDLITVHYTGRLHATGKKFDSSRDRGQPFSIRLGAGRVIRGWEQGLLGMRRGGKRVLIIPPELAYGSRGAGKTIPPQATLRFDVELLRIKRGPRLWRRGPRKIHKTSSGLRYVIFKRGRGSRPGRGSRVHVHYTGYLKNGKIFDSSHLRQTPYMFPLGRGKVIAGWDEGIALMRPGARYKLLIPSRLAYGSRGAGSIIPPNADLIFDVELLKASP